jgi:hypothetical protein
MMKTKNLFLIGAFLLTAFCANAQLEGAYVDVRNFKAFGFGGHLNFKFPITEGASLTTEGGIYIFKFQDRNAVILPVLLGYQYSLNGSGTGFFVEPLVGYSFGGTDWDREDEDGNTIYEVNNGIATTENQKVKGLTAGLATGYIFNGRTPVTVGLRYDRVFVAKDPSVNLFALRITWPLFGGRKSDY